MNYYKIKKYDISNGKGIRTTIYFCGCRFFCKECFNSDLWDFNSGKLFDEKTENYLFELISDEHCKGLSILGGEPLIQGKDLLNLVKKFKNKFPQKDIWLWTGYYLNELDDLQKEIISYCDYVIDGRFEKDKANKKLLFRGSSNQTIWKNNNGNFIPSDIK